MPRLPIPRRLPLLPRPAIRFASTFDAKPSPPKLPADQQAEFERLQREAAVSSAFQPSPETGKTDTGKTASAPTTTGEEDGVNPATRRGATPEFAGDVNPKTGEVNGPKNEPLRWGGDGDWSYNGRATDF